MRNYLFRNLVLISVILFLANVMVATPTFDVSGLSDVKDFTFRSASEDRDNSYTYTTEPPVINIRYNEGRMYIKATECFMNVTNGRYNLKGFFHENEDGDVVIEWFWSKIPFSIEGTGIEYFDYSFNCKAQGKAIIQRSLKVQENRDDVEFMEVNLTEGMDLTFRMEGYWPKMFDPSCEWLYGKVDESGLTGEFAVEKFDGETNINNHIYHVLKRCDSDHYNPEDSYVIAYIRYDGVSLWLLGADVDLPLSMWYSSRTGTINPFKSLGSNEVRIMDVYNTDGYSYSFKDLANNKISIKSILESDFVLDDYAKLWYDNYDITYVAAYDWLKRLRLKDGITVIEGIATIGNCVHSLAYPSIPAGPLTPTSHLKGGVQKLIRVAGGWEMARFTPSEEESLHTIYEDKTLYSAYRQMTSGLNTIESDLTKPISDQIYDLQGRPLISPIPGEPYIKNGRIKIQR